MVLSLFCTTANLLAVVADRIARLVTCRVYLSCSIWHKKGYAGLLYKLSSYWIVDVFGLIFSFFWYVFLGAFGVEDFAVLLFMFCSSRLLFVSCFSFLAFSFATVHKWSSWCFLQYCYLSWWYLLYCNFDHGSELLSDLLVSMLGKLSLLHLIIWIFWKLWCSWNKNLWVCPLWKIIFKDARIICLI